LGPEQAVVAVVARERETFVASDDVPLVRLPWQADGRPLGFQRPAPRLGEHIGEVLTELGYAAEIDELLRGGAVGVPADGRAPAMRSRAPRSARATASSTPPARSGRR
jgi:hypothetical protein